MVEAIQPEIVTQVRAALEHEPRVNLHRFPFVIGQDADGTLVLQGETQSIAAKKLALEVAAATPGVTGIIDRLRVVPARRMGDGEIRDHVRDSLLQEPAFENCVIRNCVDGRPDAERERQANGWGAHGCIIEVEVEDGVVTLDGKVSSISHKSLAGALAWWVPGTRDVINGIEVVPPQDIDDSEITDAIVLVMDKDPLVNSGGIRVLTRNRVVVLEGYASSPMEKDMADMDAWCVFGVDLVINRLEIKQ
jgi:osmotically-inducible protein OsmY